jgi:hypothetical protein
VIERLMKRIFDLLMLLIVLSIAIGLLLGVVRQGGAVAAPSVTHAAPNLLAHFLVTLLTGVLLLGLAVRIREALTRGDGRAGRDRASRERAMRQRVRRPAEGVPPINNRREVQADPDPAIGDDEGH